MGGKFVRLACIAAVTVGAADAQRVFEMWIANVLMTIDAASAFTVSIICRLLHQLDADQLRRKRIRVIWASDRSIVRSFGFGGGASNLSVQRFH